MKRRVQHFNISSLINFFITDFVLVLSYLDLSLVHLWQNSSHQKSSDKTADKFFRNFIFRCDNISTSQYYCHFFTQKNVLFDYLFSQSTPAFLQNFTITLPCYHWCWLCSCNSIPTTTFTNAVYQNQIEAPTFHISGSFPAFHIL